MRAVILALAGLWIAAPHAEAQAIPLSNCQVKADAVDFGNYGASNATPTDSTGHVEVKCGGNIAGPEVVVTLSTGVSGQYTDRTLIHGADRLSYNLYVDPAHHVIAGDGSQGTSPLIPNPADVSSKDFRGGRKASRIVYSVFGRIFPRQSVRDGAYNDQILVIVEF